MNDANADERQIILSKLTEIVHSETSVELTHLDESVAIREGLGIDSVDLVGIIMRVEETYKIRMARTDLESVTTIRDLIDLIVQKQVTP